MFACLVSLILSFFLKRPLNDNDYLYSSWVGCVGSMETALMIHSHWRSPLFNHSFSFLQLVSSLCLCISLLSPLYLKPSFFFCLQSNNRKIIVVTSGTGCVGGSTHWLKVYEGAKDSFWKKCFISLQSDSWWILSKQVKLRCWRFQLGSRSTAQSNRSLCFFNLNSLIDRKQST